MEATEKGIPGAGVSEEGAGQSIDMREFRLGLSEAETFAHITRCGGSVG